MAITPPLMLLLEGDLQIAESALRTALSQMNLSPARHLETGGHGRFNMRSNGIDFQYFVTKAAPEWADYKPIFCNPDWAIYGSAVGIDLGDHVATGRISPAIVSQFLGIAATLGEKLGAKAAVWHPAKILSGFPYFSEAVNAYRAGGPFPVLALVDFRIVGDRRLVSSGLYWFSGQDLSIESADIDAPELMRRAVRISHDIAYNGAITDVMTINGLDEKEMLTLTPSHDHKQLFVSISSKMDK